MSNKKITLPSAEEMLQRLRQVDDDPYLQQKFYPLLTGQAGKQKTAQGVVLLLFVAVRDCTKGLPPATERLLSTQIPDFIDAIISDTEVAADAKARFERAMAAGK